MLNSLLISKKLFYLLIIIIAAVEGFTIPNNTKTVSQIPNDSSTEDAVHLTKLTPEHNSFIKTADVKHDSETSIDIGNSLNHEFSEEIYGLTANNPSKHLFINQFVPSPTTTPDMVSVVPTYTIVKVQFPCGPLSKCLFRKRFKTTAMPATTTTTSTTPATTTPSTTTTIQPSNSPTTTLFPTTPSTTTAMQPTTTLSTTTMSTTITTSTTPTTVATQPTTAATTMSTTITTSTTPTTVATQPTTAATTTTSTTVLPSNG